MKIKRNTLLVIGNIAALIILGLLLQTGGAYLVNAAVRLLEDGGAAAVSGSAANAAANQYSNYMAAIRSLEPRQIVHAIFVAPLIEELVFRLIFLRAGKMIMPFWAANLVQAVLFGIYHSVTIQKLYGFVMGLLIGCVFYYCPVIYKKAHGSEDGSKKSPEKSSTGLMEMPDSLLGVMITFPLHMIINATGLFVMPLFSADLAAPLQISIGLICICLATFAIIVLFRQSRSIRQRIQQI